MVIVFCNIQNEIEENKLKNTEFDIIRERLKDIDNDIIEIEKKVNRIEYKVNTIEKNTDTLKNGVKTLIEYNEKAEKNGFFNYNFWKY